MKTAVWKWPLLVGVILCLLVAASCAKFEYEGAEYPPTEEVIVIAYHSVKDLSPADYEVMGRLRASKTSGPGGPNLSNSLLKQAKSLGADAIVLDGGSDFRLETGRSAGHPNQLSRPSVKQTSEFAYLIKINNPEVLAALKAQQISEDE